MGIVQGALGTGQGAWSWKLEVGSSEQGWGLRFEIADWQSGLGWVVSASRRNRLASGRGSPATSASATGDPARPQV